MQTFRLMFLLAGLEELRYLLPSDIRCRAISEIGPERKDLVYSCGIVAGEFTVMDR